MALSDSNDRSPRGAADSQVAAGMPVTVTVTLVAPRPTVDGEVLWHPLGITASTGEQLSLPVRATLGLDDGAATAVHPPAVQHVTIAAS